MLSEVILYGHDMSPPVRACLLTLRALDIPFEYVIVDLFAGEHLSEEFGKLNPQRTVPVLDDSGTWFCDSHAICAYLVDKYGKDDKLYPKDLAKRAVVDQCLFFEASILFMALRNICMPLFKNDVTVVPKEKTENVVEGYELVETFLAEHPYIAGNRLTIADFSCVSTVSTLRAIVNIDSEKYPKTLCWLERMSQLPNYEEANGKGDKEYRALLKSKLTEIIVEDSSGLSDNVI